LFIPGKPLEVVRVCRRCEPKSPHCQPKRWRASARACSQGMPAWGFWRNSSARRSNSALLVQGEFVNLFEDFGRAHGCNLPSRNGRASPGPCRESLQCCPAAFTHPLAS
jgi:hypothetical protein